MVENRRHALKESPSIQSTEPEVGRPFLNVLLEAKVDSRPLKFREIFEELSTYIFTVSEYKSLT